MEGLKLFVWEDFAPDYIGGLAFAIAKSEADARKLITEDYSFEASDWGVLSVCDIKEGVTFSVCGGS